MNKLSNLFYFVILPLAAVGFIVFHFSHKQTEKKEKAEARTDYLASPQGYKKNFIKTQFDVEMTGDGKVYLKGKVINTGEQRVREVTVTVRPAIKGMVKPAPVKIGPIGPRTEKSVHRHIATEPKRRFVQYLDPSVTDVKL